MTDRAHDSRAQPSCVIEIVSFNDPLSFASAIGKKSDDGLRRERNKNIARTEKRIVANDKQRLSREGRRNQKCANNSFASSFVFLPRKSSLTNFSIRSPTIYTLYATCKLRKISSARNRDSARLVRTHPHYRCKDRVSRITYAKYRTSLYTFRTRNVL